jgi:uncharacterized protein
VTDRREGNEIVADGDVDANLSRRSLLKGGAAMVAGMSVPAMAFQAYMSKPANAAWPQFSPDYGPLYETIDQNTGLPLLKLPKGFEYTSFSIKGDTMSDGTPTPGAHDGMSVITDHRGKVTLVRNHEQSAGTPFGTAKTPVFLAGAAGGTTNLVFDTRRGKLVDSWASLTGTIRNCAGGRNPLTDSWITCEETGDAGHGWIFDVPAYGRASAVPIKSAGRMSHEAVAVDPNTGVIYETEDSSICGFYRFIPKHRHNPEAGGKLQMARVKGSSDPVNLNGGNAGRNTTAVGLGLQPGAPIPVGQSFRIDWVHIDDPEATSDLTVAQGIAKGGCFFTRGEGAWYFEGSIFFNCTDGGELTKGQVWEYDIRRSKLTLIFVSVEQLKLNMPDNITIAPSGGILLCEDGGGVSDGSGLLRGEQLVGLTVDGDLFPFAENNMVIPADKPLGGATGDLRKIEWAGATFNFEGDWLFANIQTPGTTFAITGPWKKGALGPEQRGGFDHRWGWDDHHNRHRG